MKMLELSERHLTSYYGSSVKTACSREETHARKTLMNLWRVPG